MTTILALASLLAWWMNSFGRGYRAFNVGHCTRCDGNNLVLIAFMLRPAMTLTVANAPSQSVAVLIDTSASMQLPSGIETKTRWEIEQHVLEKLNARGEVLGKEVHWQWFGYDGQLRRSGPSI